MTKNRSQRLLEQLIKFRENDMLIDLEDGRVTEKDFDNLTELVLSVTRYVNDIRYCRNRLCRCSPEHKIKLYYDKTKHFLQGTNLSLSPIPWKTIEEITKVLEVNSNGKSPKENI